jgi:hypothetical protein
MHVFAEPVSGWKDIASWRVCDIQDGSIALVGNALFFLEMAISIDMRGVFLSHGLAHRGRQMMWLSSRMRRTTPWRPDSQKSKKVDMLPTEEGASVVDLAKVSYVVYECT